MKILKNAPTLFCDVDGTLVDITYLTEDDPNSDEDLIVEWIGKVKLTPKYEYIEALKQAKSAGYQVVVWSGSETTWAAKIIRALKLDKYVDVIVAKPHLLFDDVRTEDIFKDAVHARPSLVENPYKFIKKENVDD